VTAVTVPRDFHHQLSSHPAIFTHYSFRLDSVIHLAHAQPFVIEITALLPRPSLNSFLSEPEVLIPSF